MELPVGGIIRSLGGIFPSVEYKMSKVCRRRSPTTSRALMVALRQTQLPAYFGRPPQRVPVPHASPTPAPRLIQAVLSQFFYNASMYAGEIGFTNHLNALQLKANLRPGPRISRDLPTFKIKDPLPFPHPTAEYQVLANLVMVYHQAAAAARPMADYWGELHLRASYVFFFSTCV